jgi:alkylated DNA repair protein (DNA oxidative demethylase)
MATQSERQIAGFRILPGFLGREAQSAMVEAVRGVICAAPPVRPVTRWGKPMSVRMTSAGRLGWVIERGRYRYVARHPETGACWPPIPECVLAVWRQVSGWEDDPDCCLVNWYGADARMGLHRDALRSGDVVVMGGPARLAYHGIDRVMFGEDDLLPGHGRINLTLRVVRDG